MIQYFLKYGEHRVGGRLPESNPGTQWA